MANLWMILNLEWLESQADLETFACEAVFQDILYLRAFSFPVRLIGKICWSSPCTGLSLSFEAGVTCMTSLVTLNHQPYIDCAGPEQVSSQAAQALDKNVRYKRDLCIVIM